jgi:hypothetical protein
MCAQPTLHGLTSIHNQENMSEIIYVLINEAMPGYVKVGKTSTSLEQRMRELSSSTSLPLPFTCFYACTVNNAKFVERQIHDAFDNNRPNKRREFFQISPARIVAALKLAELKNLTPTDDIEMNPEDWQALEKARAERRSQFKFSLADVPVGAELIFINDHNAKAKVIDDRSIEFDGELTSLSASAKKLLGYKYGVQGTAYWMYESEILDERRKRLEVNVNESPDTDEREVILKVGAEGGSITLSGIRTSSGWTFNLNTIDQTADFINDADLIDEMEQGQILKTSTTWQGALELLDKYPWTNLYPLNVHSEFGSKVLDAVTTRAKSTENHSDAIDFTRWRLLCVPQGRRGR